jgi:hypothetical protein
MCMLQRQKPWLQLGGKHGHMVEGLALPRRLTPTLAFGGIRAPITRQYSAKGSPHRCALLTRNEARRGGDDVDHPIVATSMQQPTCRVSISPSNISKPEQHNILAPKARIAAAKNSDESTSPDKATPSRPTDPDCRDSRDSSHSPVLAPTERDDLRDVAVDSPFNRPV